MTRTAAVLLTLAAASHAVAQTTVDLRLQSRNVDFSAAASTRPAKTGATLPATCAVGELYFLTTAAPGANIYACTATNTWVQASGGSSGGGAGLPPMGGQSGAVLSNNGTSAEWRAYGGDVTGTPQAATVTRLRGITMSSATPTDNQAMVYDAVAAQYQPKTIVRTVQASTGMVCSSSSGTTTCRTDDAIVPFYMTGSGAPTYTCVAGRDVYTDTATGNFYFCRAANTWQQLTNRRGFAYRTAADTRTAAGLFAGTTPVAANTLVAGSVLTAEWSGTFVTDTAAMTVSLRPVANTAPLSADTPTTASLTDAVELPWRLRTSCVVLTAGAAGEMACTSTLGYQTAPAAAGVTVELLNNAPVAVNTTAALDVRLEITAVGGGGVLTATLRSMTVKVE